MPNNPHKEFLLPGAILLASLIIGGSLIYATITDKENGALERSTASLVEGTNPSPSPMRDTTPSGEFALSEQDHIRGNPSAKVTLIEFSDLECPFCKSFHPTVQRAMAEYGDNIRWVYKHFPLDQIHPKADKEAEATECAGELGGNDAFWAYVDKIFEITPSNNNLDLALLPQIAEELGLDRVVFESCLNSGKYAEHVEADYQQGLQAGITGTPGSFVNGVPVRGAVPYEQLKSIIDSQL